MLSSKPQASASQAVEGPVLSFHSRLLFPLLWVLGGDGEQPGIFGKLGQVGSTPTIRGRRLWGALHSEVLLLRTC